MFGIAAISTSFIPWFLGAGYEKVPYLLIAFSPIILCIGLNAILGQQYLIPKGEDNKYTIAVLIGAMINITLNLLLIPFLYSFGALIATVVAELAIFVVEFIFLRKELSIKRAILLNLKYLLYGAIMFSVVFCLATFVFPKTIWFTLLLILIGVVIYLIPLFIFRDDNLWFILRKIFKKRKKDEKNNE